VLAAENPVIPYRIDTLFQSEPWANWTVFGLTIATSLALQSGAVPLETAEHYFVLGKGGPIALVGYLFAHGGILHLAGNMVFLWVFGNAVCATVGNLTYLALYLGLGAFAGLTHLLVGGEPVIGASGAIAGVVGLAVALYPINRVNVFYMISMVPRTGRILLWMLALYWTAWDVIGAWFHLGPVAYWAHLGGTTAGLASGLVLLAVGRAQLTEFDHGSLLDFLLRREPPHKLNPAEEAARIELRRAARALLESYSAEAVAPVVSEKPRRLALRKPVRPTAAGPVTFGAVHPANQPNPSHQADAWPTTLPDVRYFCFDGFGRYGPMSRAEFLGRIGCAPETSRWWFWAEGMAEWHRVSELGPVVQGTSVPEHTTVADV
jgi:membrane associated rhomboid family serine protease